jgi:hypothetical protein
MLCIDNHIWAIVENKGTFFLKFGSTDPLCPLEKFEFNQVSTISFFSPYVFVLKEWTELMMFNLQKNEIIYKKLDAPALLKSSSERSSDKSNSQSYMDNLLLDMGDTLLTMSYIFSNGYLSVTYFKIHFFKKDLLNRSIKTDPERGLKKYTRTPIIWYFEDFEWLVKNDPWASWHFLQFENGVYVQSNVTVESREFYEVRLTHPI